MINRKQVIRSGSARPSGTRAATPLGHAADHRRRRGIQKLKCLSGLSFRHRDSTKNRRDSGTIWLSAATGCRGDATRTDVTVMARRRKRPSRMPQDRGWRVPAA